MIVTDRFVFLHLHRSGGTFVNDLLMRFVPDARRIGLHLPRKLVPPTAAQLPVLGLVRNPWSFYVLWYSHQVQLREPNALFRVASDHGRLDFEHTVANVLELAEDGRLLDEILAALPDRYVNRGLNVPSFALAPIRGSGRGLYSYLYHYIYDGPGVTHIAPVDRLRRELPAMLAAVGQPVSEGMRARIEAGPIFTSAAISEYTRYYGGRLRDLVAERDDSVISKHHFRFGE